MIHNGVSKRTIILFGVRFRMRFEGEEALERRFTGTIVRCENLDPLWPDSSWRYLKVNLTVKYGQSMDIDPEFRF
ncbi:auxin response factor 4 isoform X2 [Sorghum bicolor]|uniref:auxin response factor 4 isoform X2 n=1 Tax=Sorghum bicolor TaxID=4558 RepID=UPI0001A871C7|nr:auxin response factor 4 isoform X2 [Sorghum bicolor]|eukprot:XP_002447659.1 auxin response factor 4 isoform X2 [Sorghum bicolor]